MTPQDPEFEGPVRQVARRPKLFIVASGREAEFESLRNSLESDDGIEVIYDRRSAHRGGWRASERRANTEVDHQLKTRGWAVVRRTQMV